MPPCNLSNKAIQRLIEYLIAEEWTTEKILDLIDFLTK